MPGLGGVDPRQMAMMMKRMGIQVDEIEGVQEVVVRTASRDYRFRKASVTVMKAQGSETWQVQGKPEVIEKAAGGGAGGAGSGVGSGVGSGASSNQPGASVPPPSNAVAIPESDVQLVMEQAKVDAKTARRVLEETKGDLAEALVRLGK